MQPHQMPDNQQNRAHHLRTYTKNMKLLLPAYALKCVSRSPPYGINSRGRRWYAHTSKYTYTSKVSKPLRILFCGSDDFSCESLRALHKEQQKKSQLIASIDVMCRPGKKSGRGMTQIRDGLLNRSNDVCLKLTTFQYQ
jgi:hypothetical protein